MWRVPTALIVLHNYAGHEMKDDKDEGPERHLRAEIRSLTFKLKQIRDELREEIRQSTHRQIVNRGDDRPPRRSRKR